MDLSSYTKRLEEFTKSPEGQKATKLYEEAFSNWLSNQFQKTELSTGIDLS